MKLTDRVAIANLGLIDTRAGLRAMVKAAVGAHRSD
jgi:hypothetical protein